VTGLPLHKYEQAAAIVRAQVTDGTLKPGQPAPSGAQLARLTGFATLTCRKALRTLIRDGVLAPGPSPAARPRVAVPGGTRPGDAARRLSRALAAARRASGLTQPALAALTGYSVTTIGHAETSRLWQSRQFWEKADLALAAGGELTRLYDAYRAETASPSVQPGTPPPEAGAVPAALSRLTLHWSDGTVTTAYPPAAGLPL
jgi:helix-turn-helix protein/regulatory GntR family protein